MSKELTAQEQVIAAAVIEEVKSGLNDGTITVIYQKDFVQGILESAKIVAEHAAKKVLEEQKQTNQ